MHTISIPGLKKYVALGLRNLRPVAKPALLKAQTNAQYSH